MSAVGRHRSNNVGGLNDRTGAVALAFLALVGIAAPAWVLRGQVTDLFAARSDTPVSGPDTGGYGL